jgi:hypothetical protein
LEIRPTWLLFEVLRRAGPLRLAGVDGYPRRSPGSWDGLSILKTEVIA